MQKYVSAAFAGVILVAMVLVFVGTGASQTETGQQAEPAPPSGQSYIGVKKCAACHFDQHLVWRKDKHAKAFDDLPAKYKKDADCLKCHTTGFGEPTGFKTAADSHLAGISCEACHGPGSQHEEVCKPLANVTKLSAEQEATARDSIYRMLPQNVCITCHTSKGHKAHPKYDKK
jgi:hypothetical protein